MMAQQKGLSEGDRLKEKIRDSYDILIKAEAQRYSRTLEKALSHPLVEPLASQVSAGKSTLSVLDMACGSWTYVHEVSKSLAGLYPGRKITYVGADPGVGESSRIERAARLIAGESSYASMMEFAHPLLRSGDIEELKRISERTHFDLILSFNYVPLRIAPHLTMEQIERIIAVLCVPPMEQAEKFFSCMRTLLSDNGLGVVVPSVDFPFAERLVREAGMDIILELENDDKNKDFPLNERIIVARVR